MVYIRGIIERIVFDSEFCKIDIQDDEAYWIKKPLIRSTPMLNKFAYNINSQHGEDGILKRIFEIIPLKTKYAVEFGGWDGIHLSNIRNLILNNDMHAVFIEGDRKRAEEGKKNYLDNDKISFINEYVGIRKYKKLDEILEEKNIPVNFDLLSIDIDGWDYWVWESLTKYRPRVVIIEFNPTIYKNNIFINPKDEKTQTGSSALALVALGKKKEYELICVTTCNLIFVVKEEYSQFGIKDNSLDALWTKQGELCLFSTFSKKVYG